MALDAARLEGKINTLLDSLSTNTDDPTAARRQFSKDLAAAIVEEVKEIKINYSSGLAAPNGAVAGTFNHTVS